MDTQPPPRKARRLLRVVVLAIVLLAGLTTLANMQNQPALQTSNTPSSGTSAGSTISFYSNSTSTPPKPTTLNSEPVNISYAPICSYVIIPYSIEYKDASWLPIGQTSDWSNGLNGTKKICTDSNGSTTESVFVSPVNDVIYVGTYDKSTNYSGYYNVDNNYVPSPSYSGSTINGYSPTAVCADGTYSYSQHSSGTCSYHGGVSYWL